MQKILLFFFSILLLCSCNQRDQISEKDIPKDADLFAKTFVNNLVKGEIDTCYAQFDTQFQNPELKELLKKLNNVLITQKLKGFSIVQIHINSIYGENPLKQYELIYEYQYTEFWMYYSFQIQKAKGKMNIYHLNVAPYNKSLKEINRFSFKDKESIHYFFFIMLILVPLFIFISIFFCIKTPLKRKWLWIIFILLGFVAFKLNWTSGDYEIQILQFKLLGAGIINYGVISPWILSFSVPIGAIIFWFKRFKIIKKNKELKKDIDDESTIINS